MAKPAASVPATTHDHDVNAMVLVRTTVETEDQARALARRLVEQRLACCVHRVRIDSTYKWEGNIQDGPEWLVEARCPAAAAEDAWVAVAKDHPYEVPLAEWMTETRVNGKYAQWARSVTAVA